ncbi:serine/threonine-protein kinase [Rubinisphaera sp.]|uniref:serine/threonine-protein kinase n=1 Tax=Rubinisphaera sp. TaxID=2024857 RepID=UPI000C104626|nr:serine/threonine-protein kinase [Rubinisphaera sp.]MBV10487.1 hypothetical protein [Rubinisphaera sp.]|tara:strand:- start:4300 stop:7080 length:2781 start_codon:yes stop_codon:yes gene_type:complete
MKSSKGLNVPDETEQPSLTDEMPVSDPGNSIEDPFLSRLFNRLDSQIDVEPTVPRRLKINTRIVGRKRIGEGGLGLVYKYYDKRLGRDIALKIARRKVVESDARLQRFLREREVTARLQHPAIPPVFQSGELSDGRPYYLMRLINGQTFAHRIREAYQTQPLEQSPSDLRFGQLLSSFFELCDAVQYAHDQNIIHRDIKPANVMVENDGTTFLVDWGLARDESNHLNTDAEDAFRNDESEALGLSLTRDGQQLGSIDWMSPEQASGDPSQHTKLTDIYGIGASLFHIITGHAPHGLASGEPEKSLMERITRISQGEVPDPLMRNLQASPELASICRKAMSHHTEDRYQSALELKQDVQRWQRREIVNAHQSSYSSMQRLEMFTSRHRRILTLTVLTLFILLIGAGYSTIQISNAAEATNQALDEQRKTNQQLLSSLEKFTVAVMEDDVLAVPALSSLRNHLLSDLAEQYETWTLQDTGTPEELVRAAKGSIRLADIENATGNLARALNAGERAIELAEKSLLNPKELHQVEASLTLLEAIRTHARLTIAAGRLDQAVALIESAHTQLDHHKKILSENRIIREQAEISKLEMSFAYAKAIRAGSNHESVKWMEQALQGAEDAVVSYQKLIARENSINATLNLVTALNSQALTLHKLFRSEEAVRVYEEAFAILAARSDVNLPPALTKKIEEMQITLAFNSVMTYRALYDYEGARKVRDLGVELSRKLQSQYPLVIRYSQEIARGLSNYAEVPWVRYLKGQKLEDLQRAIIAFREAAEEYESVLERFPERLGYRSSTAIQYLRLSFALFCSGEDTEALKAFRKCLSMSSRPEDLEPLHSPNAFATMTGYCLLILDEKPDEPAEHEASKRFEKLTSIFTSNFTGSDSHYVEIYLTNPLYRKFESVPAISKSLKTIQDSKKTEFESTKEK